jgi:1,4-dihydroxy-2-naphthoate octaprenyltransferase
VLVGTAVATTEGGARALPALAALAGALLLQIGSNLANDVFDYEKGADGADRLGPPRTTQMGLLSPAQVKRGAALVFACAAVVGLYLVAVGGWPVLAVGILSILAALTYTGGPWPFGYHGLGDLAVFLFFGVVAVVGSHYVQTAVVSPAALAASLPVGALATAILVVNNLRDLESDSRAGKRTLAVRLGLTGTRCEYAALVGGAFLCPLAYWLGGLRSAWVLLPVLVLPRALALVRAVCGARKGAELNAALSDTARLMAIFSLLLALGWVL